MAPLSHCTVGRRIDRECAVTKSLSDRLAAKFATIFKVMYVSEQYDIDEE
jgi:hypothetical protein